MLGRGPHNHQAQWWAKFQPQSKEPFLRKTGTNFLDPMCFKDFKKSTLLP